MRKQLKFYFNLLFSFFLIFTVYFIGTGYIVKLQGTPFDRFAAQSLEALCALLNDVQLSTVAHLTEVSSSERS